MIRHSTSSPTLAERNERQIRRACRERKAEGAVLAILVSGPFRTRSIAFRARIAISASISGLMTEQAGWIFIECGAVTNASKTSRSWGHGDQHLVWNAAWLRTYAVDNPAIRVVPPSYTHGLLVLRLYEHFVGGSIRHIEVDLAGFINSETAGETILAGLGGLPDFIAGANAAGRQLAATIATPGNRRGLESAAFVADGAMVSVEAEATDVVVTEWGAAALRGCDVEERATHDRNRRARNFATNLRQYEDAAHDRSLVAANVLDLLEFFVRRKEPATLVDNSPICSAGRAPAPSISFRPRWTGGLPRAAPAFGLLSEPALAFGPRSMSNRS